MSAVARGAIGAPFATGVAPTSRDLSNAHFGFDDFDDGYSSGIWASPGSDIRPGLSRLHVRRLPERKQLPGLHLLYDGPMRGVSFRPRSAVQPQPILRW